MYQNQLYFSKKHNSVFKNTIRFSKTQFNFRNTIQFHDNNIHFISYLANIFRGRIEYELIYSLRGAKHRVDYSVHIR